MKDFEAKNIKIKDFERTKEGFSPRDGARPLQRAISKYFEDTLAESILNGTVNEGDFLTMDVDKNGNVNVMLC